MLAVLIREIWLLMLGIPSLRKFSQKRPCDTSFPSVREEAMRATETMSSRFKSEMSQAVPLLSSRTASFGRSHRSACCGEQNESHIAKRWSSLPPPPPMSVINGIAFCKEASRNAASKASSVSVKSLSRGKRSMRVAPRFSPNCGLSSSLRSYRSMSFTSEIKKWKPGCPLQRRSRRRYRSVLR